MSQGDPNVLSEHKLAKKRTWRLEEFAFVGLIGFSIIGEYVGNVSPTISFWYWVVMIPAFAIVAIITEWSQARADGIPPQNVIFIQIVHWGGACIALLATYSLWNVGRLGNEPAGLVTLLILALTTFLDGYHVGWRFYLAGLLLFLYTFIAAYLKAVIWIGILLAVPVIIVGLYWGKHSPLPTRPRI
jgi:hypothetical protein